MNQNENLIQKFGYTEMYEWSNVSDNKFGLFVQFDKRNPNKIKPYTGDGILVGVSTICSVLESDNPDNWRFAYMTNETGEFYLKKETLAVGIKEYDQNEEISFIRTQPWSHYVKVNTDKFNANQKYIKRTDRIEWVRVNMLGKVIVRDNGKCLPGKFCEPVVGTKDKELIGTAKPAEKKSKQPKFYVLERVSSNSILILNNALTNIYNGNL